jgi:hypothetical protein
MFRDWLVWKTNKYDNAENFWPLPQFQDALLIILVGKFMINDFDSVYSRVSWYWNQDHCQAGEGSFCYKSLQNMFKNIFGPLAASSNVYTFRAMQYIWIKNDFSQYRVYGYQKTQNFT